MQDNKRRRSTFIPSTDIAGILLPNNTFAVVDVPHNSPFEVAIHSTGGVYEFQAVVLSPNAVLVPKDTDWFMLEEDVDELQKQGNERHDYSIHPTPLMILLKEVGHAREIINGKVTVKLVSETGRALNSASQLLRGEQSGTLNMGEECSVGFNLQTMNISSEPRKLEFIVEANTPAGPIKQTIYSTVFSVYDKAHDAWNTPSIVRLNPVEEEVDDRTYVCIVGCRFSTTEKIRVFFWRERSQNY